MAIAVYFLGSRVMEACQTVVLAGHSERGAFISDHRILKVNRNA
jgi:hypothetical protein